MISSRLKFAFVTFLALSSINLKAGRLDTATYQIKISPTKMLLGDYGIQYETAIAKHFAVNVGAGLTHKGLIEIFPQRFRYSNGKSKPGISGQLSMRWYLKRKSANRGFSIEPMYRYQLFHASQPVNTELNGGLNFNSSLSDKSQVSINIHYSLNFLYQIVSKGNWVFTPYLGFGIMENTQIYTHEKEDVIIDKTNNTAYNVAIHERNKISGIMPSFKAGIEIGILKFKK